MSTLRTSADVQNISMNNPWVRLVPWPSVVLTVNSPGVRPSTIAAATIPPTICANATTAAADQAAYSTFVTS